MVSSLSRSFGESTSCGRMSILSPIGWSLPSLQQIYNITNLPKHEPMLEELLTAKVLVQHFVRQIVHVFEDGQPAHPKSNASSGDMPPSSR